VLSSLIVPVYNEQEGLAGSLTRPGPGMRGMDSDYQLIFVDDGSTGVTALDLANWSAAGRRVIVGGFRTIGFVGSCGSHG